MDKYCLFDDRKNKFDLTNQMKLLRERRLAIPSDLILLQSYENYSQRVNSLYECLKLLGYHFPKPYEGKVQWRLVIGFGHDSVYETSLFLHRNYSIPYVPGSAVKGVAHHYAVMQEKEGKITQEKRNKIFGTEKRKGEVIFFDALPLIENNRDFIVLDVMNVHYGEYYRDIKGTIAPGDWMSPNPIFFLTVEGIKFKFAVASRNKTLAEQAMRLLKGALSEIGIGAKTSSGYGYFAT